MLEDQSNFVFLREIFNIFKQAFFNYTNVQQIN